MIKSARPGYQARKRADGMVAHYWNPKRAHKDAPAVLGMIRLPDDVTDDQINALSVSYTHLTLPTTPYV